MSVGAVGNGGHATSIAVETTRKANEAEKAQGQAAIKLLDDAAHVSKQANGDPQRGRIIDIHA